MAPVSLVRLADRIGLTRHHTQVLNAIGHPDLTRDPSSRLRSGA